VGGWLILRFQENELELRDFEHFFNERVFMVSDDGFDVGFDFGCSRKRKELGGHCEICDHVL
jgi:hypothetical protein